MQKYIFLSVLFLVSSTTNIHSATSTLDTFTNASLFCSQYFKILRRTMSADSSVGKSLNTPEQLLTDFAHVFLSVGRDEEVSAGYFASKQTPHATRIKSLYTDSEFDTLWSLYNFCYLWSRKLYIFKYGNSDDRLSNMLILSQLIANNEKEKLGSFLGKIIAMPRETEIRQSRESNKDWYNYIIKVTLSDWGANGFPASPRQNTFTRPPFNPQK